MCGLHAAKCARIVSWTGNWPCVSVGQIARKPVAARLCGVCDVAARRPDWRPDFLRALKGTGDPKLAARAAGIAIGTARNARGREPSFQAAWNEALTGAPTPDPVLRADAGGWIPAFIATLRGTGNIRASCQQAGVARSAVYDMKKHNATFAAQWAEAEEEAIEMLELAARQRAMGSSDRLMELLLKAHRPEKYGDRLRLTADFQRARREVYDDAIAAGLAPDAAQRAVEYFEQEIAKGG